MRHPRDLYPWERHCGCPTCHVRPRERCRTLRTRYPDGYVFGNGVPALGVPTTAHKARYRLYAHLWWGWPLPWQ